MPLRRDGDRIEEIESFDDWVRDRLEEAIARGEFDNLPLKGKPIRIESNPFQPELDLAFSRLRNAGMAPAWIELDREIRTMQETLARWLDATAGRLAAEATRVRALEEAPAEPAPPAADAPWHRRWWPFRLFAVTEDEAAELDLAAEWRRWDWQRRAAREQYIERAAQLDKKIELFNNSLARNLWNLEKMRFRPDKAAARFDAAIPPRDRSETWVTHGAVS
jgi:hypothetical protein